MTNEILDALVASDAISGYRFVELNDGGAEGVKSKSRNSQRLLLTFNNGESLQIDTFCSGCSENTSMFFCKYK